MAVRLNTKFALFLCLAAALTGTAGGGLYWWSTSRTASAREAKADRAVEKAQKLFDAGDYAGSDAAYSEACNLYGLVLREDMGRTATVAKFRELTLSLASPSASDARGWLGQHLIVCRHSAQASADPAARRAFYDHVLELALESADPSLAYELAQSAEDDLRLNPGRMLSKLYRGVGRYHLLTLAPWDGAQKKELLELASKDLADAWKADPADPVAATHLAFLRIRQIQFMPASGRSGEAARKLAQEAVDILAAAQKANPESLELAVAHARVMHAAAPLLGQPAEPAARAALQLASQAQTVPPPQLQALCEVACVALPAPVKPTAGNPGHTEGQRAALALAKRAADAKPGTMELATLAHTLAFSEAHDAAIRVLERALAVPPRLSVRHRLAFEARKDGLLSLLAREQLNQAIASSGDEKTRLGNAARESMRQLRLLKKPELEPGILILEAQEFFLAGQHEQAASHFDRALRLDPTLANPAVLRAAALCHGRAGNLGSSCELLEAALTLDGASARDHLLLAQNLLAMGADEAPIAAHLAAIQQTAPAGGAPMALAGDLALRSGRFWDAAEAYGSADPLTSLPKRAEALRAAGRGAQAKEEVQALLAAGKPSANRTLLACLALEETDREAAIQAMEAAGLPKAEAAKVRAALATEPAAGSAAEYNASRLDAPPPPEALLALSLWKKGDYTGFGHALEKAAPACAEHPVVLSRRIELAILQRDWKGARDLLERAEALRLHLPLGAGPAVAAEITAMQSLETGDPAIRDAALGLAEAAKAWPASADIWGLLAHLLLADNRPGEAADAAAFAVRLQPQRADRRQLLFQCQLRLGHTSDALLQLRKAAETYPFADDQRELWLTSEEAVGDQSAVLAVRILRAKTTPADLHNALRLAGLETRAGRTDEARAVLLGAAPRCVGNTDLMLSVCAALCRAGFPDDARATLRHLAHRLPPAQVAFLMARLEESNGDIHGETAAWQAALNLEPADTRPTSRAYARRLLETDRAADAAAFLRALLKEIPAGAPLRREITPLLAQSLAAGQEFSAASALAADLPDADAALLRARIALAQKNDSDAVRFARQAAALAPENTAAMVLLGSVLASDPLREAEARTIVARTLRLAPTNADVRHLEATLDAQTGRYPRAIQLLWRNLALNPNHDPSFALLSELLFQEQNADMGENVAVAGLQRDPENLAYLRVAARTAMARFQKARMLGWRMEAKAAMNLATGFQSQAMRRSENPVDAVEVLSTLSLTGHAEEALDLLERLTPETRKLPPLIAMRALANANGIRKDEARAAFLTAFIACENSQELSECLRLAGLAYPPQTALKMAREALPKRSAAQRLGLAMAAMAANLPEEARAELGADPEAYSAILAELKPHPPLHARWLATLGAASDKLGDEERAAGLYRQSVALNPDDLVSLNNLADILLRRPDLCARDDEALTTARAASFLGARAASMGRVPRRELAAIRDTLGQSCAQSGRTEEAAVIYRSVLEIFPIPETHLHLGELLEAQNRPNEAHAQYAAAAALAETTGQKTLAAKARWLEDPSSFKNNARYAASVAALKPKLARQLAETCLADLRLRTPSPALLAEFMRLCGQVWPEIPSGDTRAKGLRVAKEQAALAAKRHEDSAEFRLLLAVAKANLGDGGWEDDLAAAILRQADGDAKWRPPMPHTLPLPDLALHNATRLMPASPWAVTAEGLRPLTQLMADAPACPPIARVFAMLAKQNIGEHQAVVAALSETPAAQRSLTERRLLAASLTRLGQIQPAADLMAQVVADPRATSADRLRHLGLLQELAHPEADLRALAEIALAKDKACHGARELLADLALDARDFATATALYEGIPTRAAPAVPIKRARALRELGRTSDAANALEDGLAACPDDPWLLEAYLRAEPNDKLRQAAFRRACENGIEPDLAIAFSKAWQLDLLTEVKLTPEEVAQKKAMADTETKKEATPTPSPAQATPSPK